MVRGTRRVVALAAVGCLLAAAGCGSDDESSGGGGGDGGSSGGQTIKVGQIVTEGGVVSFPTTARGAVKAVFDEVNAAGGVNGNKIEVTTINDAVNPQNTTAATRKLIGDGVVAFVGGDSTYDCAVNNPLYAQAKVYSVGLGIAGRLLRHARSTRPSATRRRPRTPSWASGRRENIGPKICIIGVNYPGFAPQFVGANKLLAGMGLKLTYQNTTIGQSANPASTVIAAARKGCQSAVTNLTPTQTVQALQTVKRQNLDLQLMGASGQYSDLVRKGLGAIGEGYILSAQMEPWHETTSRNQAYVDLMKKNNVGLDEFSTAGYISAMAFVEALKSIKGEVTRESVGEALKKLQYKTTMLAEPYSFNAPAGPQGGNAPNVSTKMLKIDKGEFTTISDWIGIPADLRKDTVDFR